MNISTITMKHTIDPEKIKNKGNVYEVTIPKWIVDNHYVSSIDVNYKKNKGNGDEKE